MDNSRLQKLTVLRRLVPTFVISLQCACLVTTENKLTTKRTIANACSVSCESRTRGIRKDYKISKKKAEENNLLQQKLLHLI